MTPAPSANYRDALDWLYAQTRASAPRDPARMRALVEALDLDMPPKAVHVVGTNGKGSVTAMLSAAYRSAGIPVGRFVSPHVESFEERIQLSGRDISSEEIVRFVDKVRRLELEPRPAFFELCFALALESFERAGVAIAMVEAGVGAAKDATAVLDTVVCTVITTIGLDHRRSIGPDLHDIALDKAQAVRTGIPVVTGVSGEALDVVRQLAEERGSPLHVDGEPNSGRLFETPFGTPTLSGFRLKNARLATAALRLLGQVDESDILQGLRGAELPARMERFHLRECEVVLDGAHNPDAGHALRSLLERPYVLLFGAQARKEGRETLTALAEGADRVVLTSVGGEPSTLQYPGSQYAPDPVAALDQAIDICPPEGLVVVAGSLYLAGALRPLLRRRSASST